VPRPGAAAAATLQGVESPPSGRVSIPHRRPALGPVPGRRKDTDHEFRSDIVTTVLINNDAYAILRLEL